jgi:hypothetical protein
MQMNKRSKRPQENAQIAAATKQAKPALARELLAIQTMVALIAVALTAAILAAQWQMHSLQHLKKVKSKRFFNFT